MENIFDIVPSSNGKTKYLTTADDDAGEGARKNTLVRY